MTLTQGLFGYTALKAAEHVEPFTVRVITLFPVRRDAASVWKGDDRRSRTAGGRTAAAPATTAAATTAARKEESQGKEQDEEGEQST